MEKSIKKGQNVEIIDDIWGGLIGTVVKEENKQGWIHVKIEDFPMRDIDMVVMPFKRDKLL